MAIDLAEFEVLDGSLVAEVVVTYANTVFAVCHVGGDPFTIGETSRASFVVLTREPRLPLVRCRDGAVALRFTAGMRGELAQNGRTLSLTDLIAARRTTALGAVHELELAPDARATITVGAVAFEIRGVAPGRDLARRAALVDRALPPHLAAAAFIIFTLMFLAFRAAPGSDAIEFDVVPDELRFLGYFAGPEAIEVDRVHRKVPPRPGERRGTSEYRGENGRLGQPTAKQRRGRFTLRGPTTDLYARNFNPDPSLVLSSLLGACFGDLGGYAAVPHAELHDPNHADEHDHWGARNREPWPSYGVGGLGTRSTGRSAGGHSYIGGFDSDGRRLGGARRHTSPGRRHAEPLTPLTLADVRRVLTWQKSALRRCGPPGAARVHFTITGFGRVTTASVLAGDERETRSAECIAQLLRRTWFPRGVGSVAVIYPLPAPTLTHFPPRG